MATYQITPLAERFARFVHKPAADPAACWLWTGYKNSNGYGYFSKHGRRILAHRMAWILGYGSLRTDLNVLHRCDTPSCVNLSHLFLGTQRQNVADMRRKQRHAHGARHYRSRLTNDEVRAILSSSDSDLIDAARYRISHKTIAQIRRRERWTHIHVAAQPPRRRGLRIRGELNVSALLTDAHVQQIRQSTEPGRAIAKQFHISPTTVSRVRRRQSWKHVL